jgi:hypothetical protein
MGLGAIKGLGEIALRVSDLDKIQAEWELSPHNPGGGSGSDSGGDEKTHGKGRSFRHARRYHRPRQWVASKQPDQEASTTHSLDSPIVWFELAAEFLDVDIRCPQSEDVANGFFDKLRTGKDSAGLAHQH